MLALGGLESEGKIAEAKQRQVMSHVTLGLTALYKRFNLKEGRLVLTLQDGQTLYPLQSKFAVNGVRSVEPVRYITDTVSVPFKDDILKIERVIADDTKFELALNNEADLYSCFTPAMDTLRIPEEMVLAGMELPDEYKTDTLTVIYRADHPYPVPRLGYFDPERVNIELPNSHLQALLYFVASRVHNPIGLTNEFNTGNNYNAKYEAECKQLEGDGLEIDQGNSHNRLRSKGWV